MLASGIQTMHYWISTFTGLKDVSLIYTAPDIIGYCKESITLLIRN